MKTLIISPTYNERKNITILVEAIFGINPDYHLLIVDDNSPDGTA
ncbi:MAG: glycosyltransferase, partial [Candidatus Marinimicrobia bacterium]|nr:glycosyltransferase [Candidatus Neomarinimicrobiota bacterium]MBT5758555.1 glycosyltransferase [Candidatus Neomarinimicrobiota bacterium]